MKDLLRFDTVVAACALLISSITAGAMVYQTRVLQDQFSATVWPYLSVDAEVEPTALAVRVVNQGVGPALIRSAQVSIDGKPIPGWDGDFFTTLFGSLPGRKPMIKVRDASMDSSTAIRAGDQFSLLAVRVADGKVLANAAKHRFALDLCYSSINGKYWTLHYSPESLGSDEPVPVPRCNVHHAISAPLLPFVPSRTR
jgi:hypothetical protein